MHRRDFLKLSSIALLPLLRCSPTTKDRGLAFGITVSSDASVGHLVFESAQWPGGQDYTTETLIVGGGIAGVAAAYQLRHADFMLCELSQELGGSSSAMQHGGHWISQGAHYELVYPDYFGSRPIKLLEELGLVAFDPSKKIWTFTDKKYLIDWDTETQCLDSGLYRERVLREGTELAQFEALVHPFVGHLKLPTVDIAKEYHHLNEVTFAQYLSEQGLPLSPYFTEPVSYQMRDDWGGDIHTVSALAGMYYYGCRPPGETHNQIISAPSGNFYFLQKMLAHLSTSRIKKQHLIKHIAKTKDGYRAEVVDIQQQRVSHIHCQKVVYAGHKHALKYIYPAAYPLFAEQEYAPWMVINLVMRRDEISNDFWQNESFPNDSDTRYIGFVDSDLQHLDTQDMRVFTAYYCFKPEEREQLKEAEKHKEAIIQETIGHIEHYLAQRITPYIEHAYIKVMGHAMAIPKPGFLLRHLTCLPGEPNFALAGVDGGRLPLMLEAIDSGILAVDQWKKS